MATKFLVAPDGSRLLTDGTFVLLVEGDFAQFAYQSFVVHKPTVGGFRQTMSVPPRTHRVVVKGG